VLITTTFDSEANHRYAREGLGVRSMVIPLHRVVNLLDFW
jgi:hypothetical protein